MEIDRARDALEEAKERHDSEKQRLALLTESLKAQLELRKSEAERLRAIARFQQERVASMTVRAGQKGVLQSLSLQPGQWVNPGQELARVAGQEKLKSCACPRRRRATWRSASPPTWTLGTASSRATSRAWTRAPRAAR
jgi:multidrug resistance efflux pump